MDLRARRSVGRPAADVFDFLADASNNPSWQRGMRHCEWLGDGPIEVGSRYRQRASFMGRPVISVFEVAEFEPGRRIMIRTVESTFPISVERRVEPLDETSCNVSAVIGGGPSVPAVLEQAIGWFAQRSVDRDYDRLVKILGA